MQFELFKNEKLSKNCAETLGNPELCSEAHSFGLEPYEMPEVMACCDAAGTPEDEILTYCAMDLVEQVCRSVPMRLKSLIEMKAFPKIGVNQATNLLKWLNENQQECYDTLYSFSGSPGVVMPAKWLVNGGNNKQWPALNNFTISLDKGIVKAATLPDHESERLTCVDNSLNDGEIFEEGLPKSPAAVDTKHLGDSPKAPIDGPSIPSDAQRVTGSATIASHESQCEEPQCSSLAIIDDPAMGPFVLADMNLFADGPTSLLYGPLTFNIDDAALRLYGVSHASRDQGNEGIYVIRAGDAHFVISGSTAGVHGFRWATNDRPIVIREAEDGYTIDSFSVVHTDGAGEIWTITIPPTTWN